MIENRVNLIQFNIPPHCSLNYGKNMWVCCFSFPSCLVSLALNKTLSLFRTISCRLFIYLSLSVSPSSTQSPNQSRNQSVHQSINQSTIWFTKSEKLSTNRLLLSPLIMNINSHCKVYNLFHYFIHIQFTSYAVLNLTLYKVCYRDEEICHY